MNSFVLVYWKWRYDLQIRVALQIEKWDDVFLDTKATCANLGDIVSSQLLGAHAQSSCDIVSYSFRKGKASVLKTPKAGNFPWLFDVLGEESATHADVMAVGQQIFVVLYGQPTGNSMTEALVQYVHPQPREAIAHHGTASDRHRPLLPRATCEHEDVALEGS